MGKCNLSVCEHEGGAVEGVEEGIIWASVTCLSVDMREEQLEVSKV